MLQCISTVVVERYCIAVGLLRHRKNTKIVQIWHAPDAIKKFGYQTLDTPSGLRGDVARVMGVHRNYSYVICPAKAVASYFCEAFDVDESKLAYLGLPRVDFISEIARVRRADRKDNRIEEVECEDSSLRLKARIEERYPVLKDRGLRTLLYAPTFRDGRPIDAEGLLRRIDFRSYNAVLKLHPLDRSEIRFEAARAEGLIIDEDFGAIDWFSVADAAITDYSGFAVECAVAKLPTYFYVYDLEEYMKERGLNIDLREEAIARYVFEDAARLMDCVEGEPYDFEALRAFREKYLECEDFGNTERLAAFAAHSMI
ncbi:MAG: CDP-glycerol glycerophosphotransferase family protein [Clostridiales Family XIII bacterium]|jgi:CDP-ribitol ribitolphosphotransferase|nr:CDP-glycerol glycerophosphotransferase family protein [Clostridiales Family XIII bacterium]